MTALATAAVDAMAPASPTPFTPSGFTGKASGLVELEARQASGLGQRIVEHRAGQQLTVVAGHGSPRALAEHGRCRRGAASHDQGLISLPTSSTAT